MSYEIINNLLYADDINTLFKDKKGLETLIQSESSAKIYRNGICNWKTCHAYNEKVKEQKFFENENIRRLGKKEKPTIT